VGQEKSNGTASETKFTQFITVLGFLSTALASIIDEFKISGLINCLKGKGKELSQYLRLVIQALIEGREIKIVERIRKLFPGNEYLKLISDEEIIIDECAGGYIITEDNITFSYIDPDFENYENANEPSEPTPPISVGVYELQKPGTLQEIFDSVTKHTEIMELSLEQLQKFILRHKKWLPKNSATLIVYKNSKGKFFVAGVSIDDDGTLYVYVDRLAFVILWRAQRRPRVVLPKLDTTIL